MTDPYTLTPKQEDPPWATSKEPAPALWVRWCLECEKGNTPRERGYGPLHRTHTTNSLDMAMDNTLDGYSPWQRVEGTGPSREAP